MPLNDFMVMHRRDLFELEDQPLGTLSFPCCCCLHKDKKDTEDPCNACGHNLNIQEPKEGVIS